MRAELTFPPEVVEALAEAVAARVADLIQPVPPQADEILDTAGAAAYLRLSKTQMEIWRCRGGGPPFVKLQRRVRYKRSDLNAWLAGRQRANTGEPS